MIYGNSKKILVLVTSAFTASIATATIFLGLDLRSQKGERNLRTPTYKLTMCFRTCSHTSRRYILYSSTELASLLRILGGNIGFRDPTLLAGSLQGLRVLSEGCPEGMVWEENVRCSHQRFNLLFPHVRFRILKHICFAKVY